MADIQKAMKSFEKKGFGVHCFENGSDAAAYMKSQIHGCTIGFGGSKTVEAIGLYDALQEDNEIFWHWKDVVYEELKKDDKEGQAKVHATRNKAMTADIYVCSANAVSETGEIVNIDGSGNRISSTLWGHKKVYFVVSRNKIMPSFEEAIWRARNVAAPLRARSVHKQTPCAVGELKCYDCDHPDRVCRGMAVIWEPLRGQEYEIVFIDEDYGM